MLPRIETSEVIRRATTIFRQHNEQCPEKTFIRKTALGDREISRREGLIPESVTTTFHTLLTAYIHNYNVVRKTLDPAFQDPNHLPTLWTNAVRMGKIAHCSGRTIRNHLKRLKELKMIQTQKHGNDMNFEVFFSKDLLFGPSDTATSEFRIEVDPEEHQRKNFPVLYTQGNFKKETDNAAIFNLQGNDSQGNWGRTDGLQIPVMAPPDGQGTISSAPAAAVKIHESEPYISQKRPQEVPDSIIQQAIEDTNGKPQMPQTPDGKPIKYDYAAMLAQFWTTAKYMIYSDKKFTKEQEELALAAIMVGVYENFGLNLQAFEWEGWHQYQMEKLTKACKFLEKHPDSFASWPYSVHQPGKGYFDQENQRGFAGIDKWMQDDQYRREERKRQGKLNRARTDFEKLASGAPLRKEVANLDIQSLYQLYSNLFASYGQKWQQKFFNQFEAQKSRNFQSLATGHKIPRGTRPWNFKPGNRL